MNRQQKKAQKDAERREKMRKAKIVEEWQRCVDELVYAMVNREQTGGIMLLLDDEENLREGYMMAEACVLAAERLEALDRTIADLEDARAALRRLASACAAKDSGPCPIIAAFQGEAA